MSILERYKLNKSEDDHNRVVRASQEIYQVKEYGGELWLTYNDNLVCPCSMLNTEPVDAVNRMRELFIKRTPKVQRL